MSIVNIVNSDGICWSNKSILMSIVSIINGNAPISDKTYFFDELLRRVSVKFEESNFWSVDKHLCMDTSIIGKCPALCFAVYHQHTGLTRYVLSKMEPEEITQPIFKLACEYENMNIIQMLCEKDPVRFYIKTNKKTGEQQGKIRTQKERYEYLEKVRKDRMYTALMINKFSKRTVDNAAITGIPKDVLRYAMCML